MEDRSGGLDNLFALSFTFGVETSSKSQSTFATVTSLQHRFAFSVMFGGADHDT